MENCNNIKVHQTDERMYFLRKLMCGTYTAQPLHIFAPNIPIEARTLEDIPDSATVIGGKVTQEALSLANSRDITIINIMEDERFQADNARLTAQGALSVILEHSLLSLEDMQVLVIGFGRTGAAVARVLDALDVSLDIASNSSVRQAYAFAERVIPSSNFDLSRYDVIINTVPKPLISDTETMTIKSGAIYIDLASKPGINLEYAAYLGVDADIYPALPAKYCPISAANAMYRFIKEVLKND